MEVFASRVIGKLKGFVSKKHKSNDLRSLAEGSARDLLATCSKSNVIDKALKELGYIIFSDINHPGHWIWMHSTDGCKYPLASYKEAIEDAWHDVKLETMSFNNMTELEWNEMPLESQVEIAINTQNRLLNQH